MTLLWFILISIPLLSYFGFSLALCHGIKRNYEINQAQNLFVSVIVAARNEAENIHDCLTSLTRLDYPEEFLEIIIINDRSEDTTDQIISQFINDKSRFKYLSIFKSIPNLSGKASAISQAIGYSKGEIIIITDADCVVPKNWVQKMTSYFTNQIGVVAGFSLLDFSKGLFNKIQNLDWTYLLSVAAGAVGLGIPLTCMGNNFAFRRGAYDEVGGYEGVGFSVTEDFALLKAIAQKTKWKIAFPIDPECLVNSKPTKSLKDFFSQRKRWATGGMSVHWFGKILITTSLITHLIFLGLLIFSQKFFWEIAMLLLILFNDYLILKMPLNLLNMKVYLKYLPHYKIFFLFYSIVLLFQLLFIPTITWKGIQYNSNKIIRQKNAQ